MPATIATIIAGVAVFEKNALMTPETSATASVIRIGHSPTSCSESAAKARRRSRR